MIRDVILDLCNKKKDWVFHEEIVDELLSNKYIADLANDIRARKGIEKQESVANMIAWFSQKITEYENGNLEPESYGEFYLIEEAYGFFDRKRMKGRYAYRLSTAPRIAPEVVRERMLERLRKVKEREEFRKFVEELQKAKVSAEEYRRRITEWREKHRH